MNAVITLLPQFWTCSEKKKGAKIQSVLPGEFLSHFARLKDPIQLIIRISRVSGETRCAKMHRSAGVSNEEKANRVFFLHGPHANAIPVLVAKDEDN